MDEVVLTEAADLEENGVNLEDKDTISAFLRKKVSLLSASHDRWLIGQVEELITKAKLQWHELHKDDEDPGEMMLPLIRLRVS